MAKRKSSRRIKVRIKCLVHAEGLPLPAYQSEGAAGLDVAAALDEAEPLTLRTGAFALIPTGLVLELPAGTEAQVRPRSGLAARHGVTVLNSPGTIDCDYRGEVKVLLINLGRKPFKIQRGERIAQIVIAPVAQAKLKVVAAVSETARGDGGFGSTGMAPDRKKASTGRKKKALPGGKAKTKRQPRKAKPPR